jgi:hypothetical protein
MSAWLYAATGLAAAFLVWSPQGAALDRLAGPYLGQKPPGATPEIFAPGIVSLPGQQDYGCSFSPDGRFLFFSRGSKASERDIYWVSTKILENLRPR